MRRRLRCRFNVIYQKLARRRAVAVLIRRRAVARVEGGGRLLSLEGVEAPRSLQVFRGMENQPLARVGPHHVAGGVQVGRRVALPATHVIVQVVLLLLLLLLLALLHSPGTATPRVAPVVLLSLTVSLTGVHRGLLGAAVAAVALVAVSAVRSALGLWHRIIRLPVVQLSSWAVEHLLLHHHDLVVLDAVAAVALPAVVLPAATDALQLDLDLMLGVAAISSPTAAPAGSLPARSTPRSVVRLPAAIPAPLSTVRLPGAPLPAVRPLLRPIHRLPAEPSSRQTIKLILARLSSRGAVASVPSFNVLTIALVTPVGFVPTVPVRLVTWKFVRFRWLIRGSNVSLSISSDFLIEVFFHIFLQSRHQ